MRQIFDALRKEILELDPGVTEEFLKLYVPYKAETDVRGRDESRALGQRKCRGTARRDRGYPVPDEPHPPVTGETTGTGSLVRNYS